MWQRRIRLASLLALGLAGPARGKELLLDGFDAGPLDASRWHQPEGCGTYYGRTQIRPPADPLAIGGGVLRLRLDTYDPTGLAFLGSEIVSNETFAPADGDPIAVAARVRLVAPVPAGLDASLFLYRIRPPADACDASPPRDEIDFELLTSQLASGQLLTTVYDDEAIGGAGEPVYAFVEGFDPRAWHVLELDWWADFIEWRVDGELVRVEVARIPAGPLAVRANFWAPAADFPDAFASPPDPTGDPAADETWTYQIDWIRVTLPEPRGAWRAGAAVAALLALARVRADRTDPLTRSARAGVRRGSRRCSTRSRVPPPAAGRRGSR